MSVFDFTFIVDADPETDDFEDRFIEVGCDDATFLLMRGAAALSFDREAPSYKEAVLSAYQQIKSTGADIIRFEPDFLVSATDIAERSGKTKQSIALYIKGDRKSGFPLPHARIASSNPLWDWVEVSEWLLKNQMIDEEVYREAAISRIINASAQMNQVIPAANINIEAALLAA